ncbi:hypothetical protein TREES_T100016665 [Tupaia chinensis]|uniref:Uncharacterized protein n=1 Tax=Tupaia chinensis TaxID=246437 RepID=L9L6Z2_TUPCH|nr:hypothetical protein TREES_T100016665 [Tupaia chinensis]
MGVLQELSNLLHHTVGRGSRKVLSSPGPASVGPPATTGSHAQSACWLFPTAYHVPRTTYVSTNSVWGQLFLLPLLEEPGVGRLFLLPLLEEPGVGQLFLLPLLEEPGVGRLFLLPLLEEPGVGRLFLLPLLEEPGVGRLFLLPLLEEPGVGRLFLLPLLEEPGVGRLFLLPLLEEPGVGRLFLLPLLEEPGVGQLFLLPLLEGQLFSNHMVPTVLHPCVEHTAVPLILPPGKHQAALFSLTLTQARQTLPLPVPRNRQRAIPLRACILVHDKRLLVLFSICTWTKKSQ